MSFQTQFIGLLALTFFFSGQICLATPVRDPDLLKKARIVTEVTNNKEFMVDFEGANTFKPLQVFVVLRQVEDPLRKGWYEFEFVGRAAVVETAVNRAHFVLYKPFKGVELKKDDRILDTGDPLTLDEMDMMRKEVLGVLQRDKELEDLYTGLISIKLGLYNGSLDATSDIGGVAADTNAYKKANSYFLKTVGVRWWLFFNPAMGINFEYASGAIPTVGNHHEPEQSSQTYLNPGLIYRSRFLFIPAIYSLTYSINSFSTTNPDDFLIGSTYSGVNLGVTFYYPYRIKIFRLGRFTFSFNNIEAGMGYAPSVQVSDSNYSRGESVSAHQLSLSGGMEFNLAIRGLHFTNDLFFVFEGGRQSYDLAFTGATKGVLPSGLPIPQGVHNTETQTWYGVRLKYNMRDYLGELLYGL